MKRYFFSAFVGFFLFLFIGFQGLTANADPVVSNPLPTPTADNWSTSSCGSLSGTQFSFQGSSVYCYPGNFLINTSSLKQGDQVCIFFTYNRIQQLVSGTQNPANLLIYFNPPTTGQNFQLSQVSTLNATFNTDVSPSPGTTYQTPSNATLISYACWGLQVAPSQYTSSLSVGGSTFQVNTTGNAINNWYFTVTAIAIPHNVSSQQLQDAVNAQSQQLMTQEQAMNTQQQNATNQLQNQDNSGGSQQSQAQSQAQTTVGNTINSAVTALSSGATNCNIPFNAGFVNFGTWNLCQTGAPSWLTALVGLPLWISVILLTVWLGKKITKNIVKLRKGDDLGSSALGSDLGGVL